MEEGTGKDGGTSDGGRWRDRWRGRGRKRLRERVSMRTGRKSRVDTLYP